MAGFLPGPHCARPSFDQIDSAHGITLAIAKMIRARIIMRTRSNKSCSMRMRLRVCFCAASKNFMAAHGTILKRLRLIRWMMTGMAMAPAPANPANSGVLKNANNVMLVVRLVSSSRLRLSAR